MFINRHLLLLHKFVKYRTSSVVLIKIFNVACRILVHAHVPDLKSGNITPSPSEQELKKHLFCLVWNFYTKMLNLSLSTKV